MTVLLLVVVLLLAHAYALYPLSLWVYVRAKKLDRRERRPLPPDDELPKVSVVFSAYNEEAVLEAKIDNCLALDWPRGRIEVLVGSDGSSDLTAEILEARKEDVRGFVFAENRGKAAVLNDLVEAATGEILLFCDANTMLLPNALRELARAFRDPGTGCASGRLVLRSSPDAGGGAALSRGESAYWSVESAIKILEGSLGALMGANGALFALRKGCWSRLPADRTVMDDFFTTVTILAKGWRSVYVPTALGFERASAESSGEFRRKIRIGRANFNFLRSYLPLLDPRRPAVAYAFFGHKLLRWFSPLLLALAMLFSFLGLFTESLQSLCSVLLALQLFFHAAALAGWALEQAGLRSGPFGSRVFLAPYYFDSMNVALLLGFVQSFRSTRSGGWERVAREGGSGGE